MSIRRRALWIALLAVWTAVVVALRLYAPAGADGDGLPQPSCDTRAMSGGIAVCLDGS